MTPTNLQLLRTLAGRIASETFALLGTDDSATVKLNVLPSETAWIVEDAIIGAITGRRGKIVGADATYTAEYGIVDLHVGYEDVRRDGLFGPRIVDRSVRVSVRSKIVERRTGMVIMARDVAEEHRDTVLVSEVDHLESATLLVTKGQLPREGFFSTIAEPIVVLGTVAVAIVLLFTVRS